MHVCPLPKGKSSLSISEEPQFGRGKWVWGGLLSGVAVDFPDISGFESGPSLPSPLSAHPHLRVLVATGVVDLVPFVLGTLEYPFGRKSGR